MQKIIVSIIIVHYKAKNELFELLSSIKDSKPSISYEVIVVDNDEKKSIKPDLVRRFSWVKYIPSERNVGFGSGNNLGAKYARSRYLFFLNPDTKVFQSTIDNLVNFLEKNRIFGIISPILLDSDLAPYHLQGTLELTPKRAIFALSFINKIFPNNPISRAFWLSSWDKKRIIEPDVIPGTALMIRKKVFEKIGGFDTEFFLFFEENDLCKRVKSTGLKLGILPKAKLVHYWGKSTKQIEDAERIFSKSRFLYFKKHFGILEAFLVELLLGVNSTTIYLLAILAIGFFLRLDRISELMMFIGDQGWLYLSARDMLLTGNIPLIGITSSHTWLHQGPLWTYMLAGVLWVSNFNPVSGAVLTAIVGIASIFLIYKLGEEFFSHEFGLIAALIYATSPLIIIHERLAYHTSPIPFLVLILIYSLIKVTKGNPIYFPVATLSISLLYNFELATVVFIPVVLFFLVFGFYTKEKWVKSLNNRKIILLSVPALIIPMIPILIYDFEHGFPQTLKFGAWFLYKGFQMVGFLGKSTGEPFFEVVHFFINKISLLIFAPDVFISMVILTAALVFSTLHIWKRKEIFSPVGVIFGLTILGLIGFFSAGAKSEAYLLMLFPGIVLLVSFLVISLFKSYKYAIFIVVAISVLNAIFISQNNYLMDRSSGYGSSLKKRTEAVVGILKQARGQQYNIEGRGEGSEFESFIMNYEYLSWWLGDPPSREKQELVFVIEEKQDQINVTIK